MSFQTTNPTENAYMNGECFIFINRQTNQNKEMLEEIKTKFNYTVPDDDDKTIIIRNNIFRLNSIFNLLSISPIMLSNDNPQLIVSSIVDTMCKYVTHQFPIYILNLINFKLLFYTDDATTMPFGFVKMELSSCDFFHHSFDKQLRLYVRSFQFDESNKLKWTVLEESNYNIVSTFLSSFQSSMQSSIQSSSSSTQTSQSQFQPESSLAKYTSAYSSYTPVTSPPSHPSTQPSQPSSSLPSFSSFSSFSQPSQSQPSQTPAATQPSQPVNTFNQSFSTFGSTFSKPASSFVQPSVNTFSSSSSNMFSPQPSQSVNTFNPSSSTFNTFKPSSSTTLTFGQK